MPRNMKHKTTRTRADGYSYEFYAPHSPFQRLLDEAMERKQLSLRELGRLLEVAPSSLWLWLHHESGIPGARAFKPDKHIPALADHLSLDEDEIREAYDRSVIVFHQASLEDFHYFVTNIWGMSTSFADNMVEFTHALNDGRIEEQARLDALHTPTTIQEFLGSTFRYVYSL